MKKSTSLVLAMSALLVVVTFALPSHAEVRFGPWVYYAPYYYPPDNQCLACVTSPLDFLPRYESPNPPAPSYDPGPQCPPMPPAKAKVRNSAALHAPGSRAISTPAIRRAPQQKRSLEPMDSFGRQQRSSERPQSLSEPRAGKPAPQDAVQRPQPASSALQALPPGPSRPTNRPMFRGQGRL
jgi:hypothetical protein